MGIKRNSYTFHESFHDAMSGLDDVQYGRIMRAANEFALYGKEPASLNGIELVVWKLVYPMLAKSRNKANGKAGRPKKIKSKSNQNQTEIKSKSNRNQKEIKSKSNRNQIEIKKAKESTLSSPLEETPPTPPIEVNPPIFPQESAFTLCACARDELLEWLKKECPYIYEHYKLPSEDEYLKLKQNYSSEAIAATCSQIENRVDLRKRYSNLYRTLLNWLKKNAQQISYGTNRPSNAEERTADAARSITSFILDDSVQ